MALRKILENGDATLRKVSRPVANVDKRLATLLDDMAETMYNANGCGLAAPQIGVLRRVVVIDTGDGLIEMINPEIIDQSDEMEDSEGCLSIPGKRGFVVRPHKVTYKAQDRNGETFTKSVEGLAAVAACHEIDHLNGVLYIDKMTRPDLSAAKVDEDE